MSLTNGERHWLGWLWRTIFLKETLKAGRSALGPFIRK